MTDRILVSSGSPNEPKIGFSRAVRVGNTIAVAGTTPMNPDGSVAAPGDAYGQTKRCIEIIIKAVEDAGGKATDIVRTRVFLTDIKTWQDAARAHGEAFGAIRPATSFVECSGLIHPDWLVEVEADAIVG